MIEPLQTRRLAVSRLAFAPGVCVLEARDDDGQDVLYDLLGQTELSAEGLPGSPIDVAEWLYQDAGAGVVADVTVEPETGGRVVSVDFRPAPTEG